MLERRWRPTGLVSGLALVTLAGVCFARLVIQPAAIIVDGERPSLDHANPAEPRGIGNDATFSFLPHHLTIAKLIRDFWPRAQLGYSRIRRTSLDRQSPSGHVLSTGLVGLVVWCAGCARMANRRTPALGRSGDVRADALSRRRSMGRDGGGSRVPSIATTPRSHIRGALSARVGRLLVSVGFLGFPRPATWTLARTAALADHPRIHLLDWSSSGVVTPGSGPVDLVPWCGLEILAHSGTALECGSSCLVGRCAGVIDRDRGYRNRAGARCAALARAKHRRAYRNRHSDGVSRRRLQSLAVAQSDRPGRSVRLFRRRQLLGNPVLDRLGATGSGGNGGQRAP